MTQETPIDPDFADLPNDVRAAIEGAQGIGLHHAPAAASSADGLAGERFHHPERDVAGTAWEPDWEPIDSYLDGDVVMLDDGERQILGMREMGMWMQLIDDDKVAQPDFLPMLWSPAPEQVKYDMM